jgi:hypothetical protein
MKRAALNANATASAAMIKPIMNPRMMLIMKIISQARNDLLNFV